MKKNVIEIITTCKDENEASKIARVLVETKFAVCCNFLPVKSIYIWNAKVENGNEWLLKVKTTSKKLKRVVEKIKELHSYKLPVITWSKVKTTREVEKWIENEQVNYPKTQRLVGNGQVKRLGKKSQAKN